MTRRKWSVLAVSAAAAASVICAGATALAAAGHGSGSHATHSNYRGPARTALVVPIRHQSNYNGPARRPPPWSTAATGPVRPGITHVLKGGIVR